MNPRISSLVAVIGAAVTALSLTGTSGAAGHTQTLRLFDKPVAITLTQASGKVVTRHPYPQPKAGDTLDVLSLDYAGNHLHHQRQWKASTHLRCVFKSTGPPSCESSIAIGSSLLVFSGTPAKLTMGTGIYLGATGRVLSSTEIPGTDNSDIVAKIQLR